METKMMKKKMMMMVMMTISKQELGNLEELISPLLGISFIFIFALYFH